MKWENKGHEYDHMIEIFNQSDITYYIWGAGVFGKAFYDEFSENFSLKAFIDCDEAKQGTDFCGIPVLSPEKFFEEYKENDIIVVSTGQTGGVYKCLEKHGLKKHQDYYHIDEFSAVYMMERYDKVYVSDLTLDITECCTLKCEYCNAFIPRIQKPCNYSLEEIREEMEQYFRWVDVVNVLGVCGGDAMVHPQFYQILEWLGDKYYGKQIKHLEVYSNAVIVPNEETITLFKKYNVIYRFTDYGGASGKQNIDEVVQVLEENQILYDHVRFSEWYDCGYPQESNGITSEEGLIHFFDLCDRKTCHGISGNKLFFCDMCVGAAKIGYCELDDSDYFDLSVYSRDRRREFIEYYLGYNEKGYFNYCKKCNGSLNVNTHIISVGEQL